MKKLYMLFDLSSMSAVGNVFTAISDPPAIRSFHDILQDKNSICGQHPEDFDLILVGDQDDTGRINGVFGDPGYITIATGRQFKAAQAPGADINLTTPDMPARTPAKKGRKTR